MTNLQTQIAALLLTLTFFIAHALRHDLKHNDGSWLDNNRNRRESVVGLIPFPRVGRSGIESNPHNMDSLYERVLRSDKREGLILFPRVGRSDSKTSALWFGPRLGKSIRMPENYDEYLQDADTPSIVKKLIEMKSKNVDNEEDNQLL